MQKCARFWISAAGLSGALAVAAGAFGAHALRNRLDAYHLGVFETGARYHLVHALALLACGLLLGAGWSRAKVSAIAFAVGTVIFSGSLYALALTGVRGLGAITPLGGLAFMMGWLSLFWVVRGRVSLSPSEKAT